MVNKTAIIGSLASLGLVLIASGQQVAQMSDEQMQQLRQNKLVSSAVLNTPWLKVQSPLVVWD